MIDCVSRSNNNLNNAIIRGKNEVQNHVKIMQCMKWIAFLVNARTWVKRRDALKNENMSTKNKKALQFYKTCNKYPTISIGKVLNC